MNSNTSEQSAKIMIVDDSDFSRKTIGEILTNYNFNIVGEASNAQDAISMAASSNANIFIIDIVMPEISGIELAKKIFEIKNNVYIIMISSLRIESIVIDAISTGAIDYIQKPFTEKDLISSIKKVETVVKKNSESHY